MWKIYRQIEFGDHYDDNLTVPERGSGASIPREQDPLKSSVFCLIVNFLWSAALFCLKFVYFSYNDLL